MKKVLAIDMGATSIRAILAYIENDELVLNEIMRYNHSILETDGRKHWDWKEIISQIEKAILSCADEIDSIGVDTWGVDFGLIDGEGNLIQAPSSYRDEGNLITYDEVKNNIGFEIVFKNTGNQIMPINTLFQLLSLKKRQLDIYERSSRLIMIPDLVNYFLTGQVYGEKTICSTSQMFDLELGNWNYEFIEQIGLRSDILPKTIENKQKIGSTKNAIIKSLRDFDIDVISVASHDTASAVYVTESYSDDNTLFLSSGTWSLMGCYTDKPIINDEAFNYNLTNELGYNGRNMFFKNITGLYLIEKLIKALDDLEGKKYNYSEITELVNKTDEFKYFIDVEDELFSIETDNFIIDIEEYLHRTGQNIANDKTDYFRMIYESMVINFVKLVEYLEKTVNRKFKQVHVIGGGSQSPVLCQMLADGLNMKILAGPKEATALGNIEAQFETLYGEDFKKNLRAVVNRSFELIEYEPKKHESWKKIIKGRKK